MEEPGMPESAKPEEDEDSDNDRARSWYGVRDAAESLFQQAALDIDRFPTGYSLDTRCGMIGPGELGLIWARSSGGKSTWYLNTIARSGHIPTVVVNMEMAPRKLAEWLIPMAFVISTHARDIESVLRWGSDDPRYNELTEAKSRLDVYYPNLQFVRPRDAPRVSDLQLLCDDIEIGTGERPRRIIIDHLSLMAGARDYEGVSKTAALLHSWAMEDDIAVIAVQQTGRGAGDGMRNDGHLPVTLSSGLFAGEHDADWIWGMYRPERNPKYRRDGADDTPPQLRGVTRLQCIKNRPYSDLCELGIELRYDAATRRLYERGETWTAPEVPS